MEALERFGPTGFQDLAAALAIAGFKDPGIQAMGPGPDGGRDMVKRGRLVWAEGGDVWSGYTVFQAKYRTSLGPTRQDDARWLWAAIQSDLDRWCSRGVLPEDIPDYLVIITNVQLSPAQGAGGFDSINQNFKRYLDALIVQSNLLREGDDARARLRKLGRLKDWRIWDRSQLTALLAGNDSVRRAFVAFLTPGDVLSRVTAISDTLPIDQLEPGLQKHARNALLWENSVYFDEAGSDSATLLHDVIFDLPVLTAGRRPSHLIKHAIAKADHVLKPSVATAAQRQRHIVLVGAPGNGKTTASTFLVQSYRAMLLAEASDLAQPHRDAIEGTRQALRRLEINEPSHRRWPMFVSLAAFADELAVGRGGSGNAPVSLIRYVANQISARLDVSVPASALSLWAKEWPWLLVLDGLDEVTKPDVRRSVIKTVEELIAEAEVNDHDLMVILTTRPLGYAEDIGSGVFERLDLADFALSDAVAYGEHVTKLRLKSDPARAAEIVKRLNDAATKESLQRLLRTPLQVLILSIIIGGAINLQPDRFRLFWNYFLTVYNREQAKRTDLRTVLQEYPHQIRRVHELLGFELQARSEQGDTSSPAMAFDELESIVARALKADGYEPEDKHRELVSDITIAATKRLVLIVPKGDNGYGFDVRSLQELMAARYMTNGRRKQVQARLLASGPSPHWRNTWLFAAGKLMSEGQDHNLHSVVSVLKAVDHGANDRLSLSVPIAPRLALDILDDGMARSLPLWSRQIASIAMRILVEPSTGDFRANIRTLIEYARTGPEEYSAVADGFLEAYRHSRWTRDRILQAQNELIANASRNSVPELVRLASLRGDTPATIHAIERWSAFFDEFSSAPLTSYCRASGTSELEAKNLLDSILLRIESVRVAWLAYPPPREDSAALSGFFRELDAVLGNRATATVFDSALEWIRDVEPDLMGEIASHLLNTAHRRPVADALR